MDLSKDIKREAAAILNEARLTDPVPSKKPAYLKTLLILVIIIITIAAYSAYAFITAPGGKITSPSAGSQTGSIVEIEGYTRNIPHDHRNIWLVVEIESLGLCWPKRPLYNFNAPFKTMIHEKGPNKEFVVSLYAVDQAANDKILEWFDIVRESGREPGLEKIPGCFRLDAVKLTLKKL